MAPNGEEIRVIFVHPTEPGKELQATVSIIATPRDLLDQLIAHAFIVKEGEANQYRLINTATREQLIDSITLEDAGICDNAHLEIVHSVTGADGLGKHE